MSGDSNLSNGLVEQAKSISNNLNIDIVSSKWKNIGAKITSKPFKKNNNWL